MLLLDEVNRTLDESSMEYLIDFMDRKWEAIHAYDAAMEVTERLHDSLLIPTTLDALAARYDTIKTVVLRGNVDQKRCSAAELFAEIRVHAKLCSAPAPAAPAVI
mmetsp:Transcript_20652/g.52927  ORF Transcript_20652/g.52927 Transcript_20652/m.52927 type:complete len:105 (-) Transcript_20652:969-1283(-)